MADTARTPVALRGEIERTRDDLAHTIDRIANRAAPGKLAQDTMEQAVARGSQGVQLANEQARETLQMAREAVPALLDNEALQRAVRTADTYRSNMPVNGTYILAGAGALVVLVLAWRSARK